MNMNPVSERSAPLRSTDKENIDNYLYPQVKKKLPLRGTRENIGGPERSAPILVPSPTCNTPHPGDPDVVCTNPVGHDGEHTALMIVRWPA